jgi:hypothetical protein
MKTKTIAYLIFIIFASCAGGTTEQDDLNIDDAPIEGVWALQSNACNEFYAWDPVVQVNFLSTLSPGLDIYGVTSSFGFFSIVIEPISGEFYTCVVPQGELDITKCDILCAGAVSGNQVDLLCQTDFDRLNTCGPVVYNIN